MLSVGKPDPRKDHIDYIPTVFVFKKPRSQEQATQMEEREKRSLRRSYREVQVGVTKKRRQVVKKCGKQGNGDRVVSEFVENEDGQVIENSEDLADKVDLNGENDLNDEVDENGEDGLNSEVDVNGKDGLTGEVNLNGEALPEISGHGN